MADVILGEIGDLHDIKAPPALKGMIRMRTLLVAEAPLQVKKDTPMIG